MLAHGGLDLLRYFYNGILSFSSADTALWFARDLLAGAVVVLLFSVQLILYKFHLDRRMH